jgi:hypothetical protein
MPPKDFQDRLAAISARRASPSGPSPAENGMVVPGGGRHRDRLARAVALAESRGLSRRSALPLLTAALARLGVPVRPPHYLSWPTLFVIGALINFTVFGGILLSGVGEGLDRGPLGSIHDHGWPGVAVVTIIGGAFYVAFIRRQARRRGLPAWHEV